MIKLLDIIQVDPSPEMAKLSKRDKVRLMDSVLQNVDAEAQRGLLVTLNLSSSGRRINNRIYTPKGQRAGVDSWTTPYPKPMILNHDKSVDPIGRLVSAEWVSNQDQALKFFDNVSQFMQLQDAFDSDSPQRIYKAMKKAKLLTNRAWPGLGALHGATRVVDEAAIEKFLDGRYLTFSAGTHTDRYACGICGDDWAQGEICDHRPGQITDGDIGIFVTGIFNGDEVSVLNMPANDFSQVLSMEFIDSVDASRQISEDSRRIDESTIYITDAKFSIGEIPMLKKEIKASPTLQDVDVRDIARALYDGSLDPVLKDALEADTHFETAWLIRNRGYL